MYSLLHLGADILRSEAELVSHQVDSLCVKTLVDTNHDTYRHQRTDELGHRHIHHVGKLRHSNKLCQLQCLALKLGIECVLLTLLCSGITLLLTILGALLGL